MRRLLLCFAFLAVCFLAAGNAFGATHYVAANGSDSNSGTNKTTAWLHAPGMTGCSANCASYTPLPGDQIILRGGDTWHVTGGGTPVGLPWVWKDNGAAGNEIYVGVDLTWWNTAAQPIGCGAGAWCRPKLNGDNPLSTSTVASCAFQSGVDNRFLDVLSSYTIFDNLEFLGLCWNTTGTFTQHVYIRSGRHHIYYKNLYFHGWTHTAAPLDSMECIQGNPGYDPGSDFGSFIEGCVFDGSDTDRISGQALFNSPPDVHNSIIRQMGSGLVAGLTTVHDNLIEHINGSYDSTKHTNMIEITYTTATIYNNLLRHNPSGQTVTIFTCGGSGATDYIFNNVIYDVPDSNVLDLDANCASPQTSSTLIYNNTIQVGNGYCFNVGRVGFPAFRSVTIRNNHCITNLAGGDIFNVNGSPIVATNNLLQTNAQANSQGYRVSNNYAPTAGGSTIGAAVNLTTSCSGSLTALCKDTSLGATTTPKPRPPTSPPNWDLGAYRYAATAPPNPPTNLRASPR